MTKPIIANWKMNFSLAQTINLCNKITKSNNEFLVVAAPFPYLAYLTERFPNLNFAAQNVNDLSDNYGSFTGEVSAEMLASCGVKYCIIGHSERRQYNNENNTTTKRKAEHCIKHDIVPIVCVGETATERRLKTHINFIKNQLLECLPDSPSFILAYEPIWSIGTGNIPSNQQLEEVFSLLENTIAKPLALVYGGSVNVDNISNIAKVISIDGLLLGKASLDISQLEKIIQIWTNK